MPMIVRQLCFVGGPWVTKRGGELFCFSWFLRLNGSFLGLFPRVVLLALNGDDEYPHLIHNTAEAFLANLRLPNADVKVLPMRGGNFRRSVNHLPILWREVKDADLVCIDMPDLTSFLASIVCKLRRRPFFVRFVGEWGPSTLLHGHPSLGRRIKAVIAEWMSRFLVRHSRLVLVQGEGLYRAYVQENPTAVQNGLAVSSLASDAFFRSGSEPLHEPIRLISVSYLVKGKGLQTLIQALKLMSDRGLRVEWWCVGDGSFRQSLEDLSAAVGVSHLVRFFGYVPLGPELFRLYREADIFVCPSLLSEGVPCAMLEAMANSLPVVVSAVGGIPGVIEEGVNGILVPPERPDLLAEAICGLVRQPDLVCRIGQAAFRTAQDYDSSALAQRTWQIVQSTFGTAAQEESEM